MLLSTVGVHMFLQVSLQVERLAALKTHESISCVNLSKQKNKVILF